MSNQAFQHFSFHNSLPFFSVLLLRKKKLAVQHFGNKRFRIFPLIVLEIYPFLVLNPLHNFPRKKKKLLTVSCRRLFPNLHTRVSNCKMATFKKAKMASLEESRDQVMICFIKLALAHEKEKKKKSACYVVDVEGLLKCCLADI